MTYDFLRLDFNIQNLNQTVTRECWSTGISKQAWAGWRICVTPAASLTVTPSESQIACHPQHTHTPPDGSRVGCGHTSVRREREKDEGVRHWRKEEQKIREISQRSCNYFYTSWGGKSKSERFLSVPQCFVGGQGCTCYIVLVVGSNMTTFITFVKQTGQIRNHI